MVDNRRYEIVLGALLHDIGKFFQRASATESVLSEISRRMESTLCPIIQGRYSHRHVLFTNEFCDRRLEYLPEGLNRNSITNYASYHHRPDSTQQEIIHQADMLSSGMEREEDEEYEGKPSGFRKIRLRPIMGEIRIEGRKPPARGSAWVHNLTELDPKEAFPFPVDSAELKPPEGEDLTKEYEELWKRFLLAWGKNRVRDAWGYVNRTLGILEHYTWCIPSATNVFPDISLYDHLKTTAAIAACLNDAAASTEPFLLVATDFGGIQNYIFAIRSGAGGLARRLRARSFLVSLLEDFVIHRILRAVDLPMTNCIISSGGKSYLLLPNTEKCHQDISTVKYEMDHWSLEKTRGEIRINIAAISLQREDLKDFSHSLYRVNSALREGKETPLRSCLQNSQGWAEFHGLLRQMEIPANGGLCDSCQRDAGEMRFVRDKQVPVCDGCHEDQEVGGILPRSKYIAFFERGEGQFTLPFGTYDLMDSVEALQGDPYLVLSMDGYLDAPSNIPLISGFRARYVPRNDNGEILTFEELAKIAQGRKSIAYMKSDVDNLGFIFSYGLKREGEGDRTSISRVTTLSRSLDIFFSGYFDCLLREEFRSVYTIYSGGDDLLCLGPWDQIMALALNVREQFQLYSCRNPAWGMSSGIALVGSKMPVLSAAHQADQMLDISKETPGHEIVPWPVEPKAGNVEKDRITVFGTSIPWGSYHELIKKAMWLSDLIQKGKINTGKVRRLLQYAEMFRTFHRTGDTRNLRYVPLLSYDLRRNWSLQEDDKEVQDALRWAQELLIPENPQMKELRFVCEYSLNAVREKEGKNGQDW
ncbi:MAG: type III-A CRISPR-associated protein Cas10/Csm1 [Deltaproteobacteria bacterium RBG_16_47_11]|nr:MAG: type III-A CRISPR-associated protein Cas10/Csm1 [Deltaproteobacteria bacterium RBG_16_47_11]